MKNQVDPGLVLAAIEYAKDRQSTYSQCVVLSYRSTGKLDCGFTAKEMNAWIDANLPDVFDVKGKKKETKS